MLRIVQFNLLAPEWITQVYANLPCYRNFIDSDRYARAISYCADNLPPASIYCLSEVTSDAISHLRAAYPNHDGFFVPNDFGYWKEWLAEDLSETTPNGVAILTDPSLIKITSRIDFSYGTGGHAAILQGIWLHTNATIRIVSLHLNVKITTQTANSIQLDSSADNQSISRLLNYLNTSEISDMTLISGDLNTFDITPFTSAGYVETVKNPDINTSPLNLGALGKIDHTLLRLLGSYLQKIQIISKVYRISNYATDISSRFCDTVQFNGSDHYATLTDIRI